MKYIALGVGAGILLYALWRTFYLRLYGRRTLGTVVGVRKDNSDDTMLFYPIVKFTTAAGATLELESNVGTSGAKDFFHPGRQVDILYSPTNPKLFVIVGYDAAVLQAILLLVAFVGGIIYWISTLQ